MTATAIAAPPQTQTMRDLRLDRAAAMRLREPGPRAPRSGAGPGVVRPGPRPPWRLAPAWPRPARGPSRLGVAALFSVAALDVLAPGRACGAGVHRGRPSAGLSQAPPTAGIPRRCPGRPRSSAGGTGIATPAGGGQPARAVRRGSLLGHGASGRESNRARRCTSPRAGQAPRRWGRVGTGRTIGPLGCRTGPETLNRRPRSTVRHARRYTRSGLPRPGRWPPAG